MRKLKSLFAWLAAQAASLVSVLKANPAVVSWALTMAVTLAARFGFHVTADQLVVLVSVMVTLLHGYVHVSTRRSR